MQNIVTRLPQIGLFNVVSLVALMCSFFSGLQGRSQEFTKGTNQGAGGWRMESPAGSRGRIWKP